MQSETEVAAVVPTATSGSWIMPMGVMNGGRDDRRYPFAIALRRSEYFAPIAGPLLAMHLHPAPSAHFRFNRLPTFIIASAALAVVSLSAAPIGLFNESTAIGAKALPGSAAFDPAKGTYRITGGGGNMWGNEDSFQFVWKKLAGDLSFTMDVAFEGESTEPHRKVGAMVRSGLETDAPYVDVAVHGDGLIELQVRKTKGGETIGIRTPIKAPATVKLERDGNVFTASVAKSGQPFQPIGALSLALEDPVCVGFAVCAHNAKNLETANISQVVLTNRVPAPGAARVRETSLEILDFGTGERHLVHRERSLFEAPNWSRDGETLYINRGGGMYTVPVGGGEPRRLPTGVADHCNNDHGLSFDGQWLAVSSNRGKDGSKVFIVPAQGGDARQVTPTGPSYWHGWSPDGKTLVFCGKRGDNFDIYAVPVAGGEERRLTTAAGLDDGPEYTPDGTKIYFNSERSGVMQIWRMNPDGSQQEQVTTDPNYADWFAHPSPDGQWLVFLSFDKSVQGHPANKDVVLRAMPLAGGKPKVIATLFGGQGTINVPSWSPDSKHIAFVSYRNVLE